MESTQESVHVVLSPSRVDPCEMLAVSDSADQATLPLATAPGHLASHSNQVCNQGGRRFLANFTPVFHEFTIAKYRQKLLLFFDIGVEMIIFYSNVNVVSNVWLSISIV